jgi:tRNA A-37 threonylcarbamoyl transferase component Bud32
MDEVDAHPSPAQLDAFALGSLDDAALETIEAHVADCPTCQERAGAAGDSLVDLLRQAHARTESPRDAGAATATPTLAGAEAVLSQSEAPTLAREETIDLCPSELAGHERYRLVRLLGEGGMGAVYEAEHRVMQRVVALKVIRQTITSNPAAVERFRREVRAAARLSHPNIVTTYDAEDVGATQFLVMEYVQGITLGRLVKERGRLPAAEACEYIRQAALGLQHAHERGMVHRDVKPENLIRTAEGALKVLDFGLATLTAERSSGGLTDSNVLMGTPDYMAPEQAEDPRTADSRADIYSLGCTLYYLLTGKVPFAAATPVLKILAHREEPPPSVLAARPETPPALARIVTRMLAKKPQDRYQSPGDVAAALETFCRSETGRQGEKETGSKKAWWIAAGLLLLGLVAAAAVVYHIHTDTGELIVRTESDDVEVVVKQGGKVVRLVDAKSNAEITLVLRSGAYELELLGAPKGLKLTLDKATLKRGEKVLARIERVAQPDAKVEKAPVRVGEFLRFEPHANGANCIAFSEDGKRVFSGGADGVIHVSSAATGKLEFSLRGHTSAVQSLAVHPDGLHLASGGADHTLRIWDLTARKQLHKLTNSSPTCWYCAISPDGKKLVGSCDDSGFRIWDFTAGAPLGSFDMFQVNAVAFAGNDRVAAAGSDCVARLWDVKSHRVIHTLKGHESWVRGLAVSVDGAMAVTASGDELSEDRVRRRDEYTVRLWDLASGEEKHCFQGHKHTIWTVALSRDNRWILSGSLDGTVRLWDVANRKEKRRFDVDAVVNDLAFSHDGKHALSADEAGEVRLWRIPTGKGEE